MGATFDTSGYVPEHGNEAMVTLWTDLSPFTQGYVEALMRDACADLVIADHEAPLGERYPGFSDLAPETLARIMEDCERYPLLFKGYTPSAYLGGSLWVDRQAGKAPDGFPPLTPYLGDDGKVYLKDHPPGDHSHEG